MYSTATYHPSLSDFFQTTVTKLILACVRTFWRMAAVWPDCCRACAGTCTVSCLGCDVGLPGWAGIVICKYRSRARLIWLKGCVNSAS